MNVIQLKGGDKGGGHFSFLKCAKILLLTYLYRALRNIQTQLLAKLGFFL